jgi:RNA polymerase sigma-70 factor (ECF subfamily)
MLAGNRERADDLAEATIILASTLPREFIQDADIKIRMFTFLHKLHYGALNERSVPQRSGAEAVVETLHTRRGELNGVKLRRFQRAFWRLPDRQREALVLEAASGFSRDEVAAICGCTTAAVTALVALARRQLISSLIDCEGADGRGAASWPSTAGQVDDELPDDVLLPSVGVPGYEPRA